ncbi:peptidoglycan D,D-transpeptidase FtsI family protein [Bacillus solitudinis]|uniref:peptidoglycan D,D-transpeptidase FtsI family protein n=1 Tax=Bacillus solitudinis TaxID=2014074 RepID=UPI000C24552E|nr:penicillin-binding protein 2 [Bacillus solitudinis]
MEKKRRVSYTYRLNILFLTIFLLFSSLIFRLGYIQIINGEAFASQIDNMKERMFQTDVPRGLMVDRYGTIVVNNKVEFSVTYMMPSENTRPSAVLKVAQTLEPFLTIDTSKVTERDKKDYLLVTMAEEERYQLVSREVRNNVDSHTKLYRLEVEAITEKHLKTISDKELKIIAIFREMVQGTANAPQRIKRGLTDEEAHLISENLDLLPGIDIQLDSSRIYPYGDAFRGFFGNVNLIPSEKLPSYLVRGYERNEVVGTSYLEAQYEELLKGVKAVTSQEGENLVGEHLFEKDGQRGNDLILSIDMELQQKLEDILDNEMDAGKHSFIKDRSAYAVILHPRTGDVLAMAGFLDSVERENSNMADHVGVVNKAFEMGSSVKAASVLTGFQEGVTSPGTKFNDRTIYLPSTPPKGTWNKRGFGWIDDVYALEQSSNVYMFEIGMRLANCYYAGPNTQCGWTSLTIADAYNVVRNSFSQFGLGAETGIDLPSSFNGMQGENTNGGKLLDLMIGQYDTYTTLQLAQYIATIASDGYRMKVNLVTEIREPVADIDEHGAIIHKFEPRVLNRIEMSNEHIKRTQLGLRRVVTHGNAAARFSESPQYEVAGKTGTAQVKVGVQQGEKTTVIDGETQTFVGYAPFNDPEIAFAVVVPHAKLDINGARQGMAQHIARDAVKAYFELKEKRTGPSKAEEERDD